MYVNTKQWRGMGDQQSAQQAVGYGSAAAGSALAIASAAHLIPAVAVPFIGPALAGATLLISSLIKNSGCGQTCVITSQWANQAAQALQQNLDAYRAMPTPRPRSAQQLAIQNFDQIWQTLVQQCSQPNLGDAGKRCISDRQQGACHYKDNGQCWNWFVGYRDPIANDPNVVDDSVLAQQQNPMSFATSGASSSSLMPALLIAGLLGLAVAL